MTASNRDQADPTGSATPDSAPLPSLGHSIAAAAKLAGVSRALLYKLWAAGEGPPRRRIGRRVVVPHAGLVAWLNAGGSNG
ncbi:helix-turn-helix domain-containing protein [Caenispirillum bisanense]|uniref:helix-turn-helix domain-containing protein n=1 Tax=Caenispirillum bisanense TaxID=414052 RepID=UPI0033810557